MDVDLETAAARCLDALTQHPMVVRPLPLQDVAAMAVFGRYCSYVARTMADVINVAQPGHVTISGKEGKDSGPLGRAGIAEAHYLLSVADALNGKTLSNRVVTVDLKAKDGLENAANMTALLQAHGVKGDLLVLAHRTQMLRLGLTMVQALRDADLRFNVTFVPSGYRADPRRLLDQWEIFFEVCRMAELDEQGELAMSGVSPDILRLARQGLAVTVALLEQQGVTAPSTAGLRSA